ncbi:MAG: hypothetical protein JW803_03365 [Endomicrobiales bacterium]|nr:hypothetical protein [Endomicrobiales bacterium]
MKKMFSLFIIVLVSAACVVFARSAVAGEEDLGEVVLQRGYGEVRLIKLSGGAWQMIVDNEPFIVKGVEYSPDLVGVKPKTKNEWMNYDSNLNGVCDPAYESWVDKNANNFRDKKEKPTGDFKLLEEMGCNTIRIYHPTNVNKQILRDLYKTYGIRVIMGNFLGAYTMGSGAEWSKGTDYSDPGQREKMKESVREMVLEHMDEPYVLLWMLGNENDVKGYYENSTFTNTNAYTDPETYARFVGEVSKMIKKLDPDHPVGVCNASYGILKYYDRYADDLDIIGMNAYKGPYGFGTLWDRVKFYVDRPVIITEYGCDVYNQLKGSVEEDYQARYHGNAWKDIEDNSYLGEGTGNSLGGVIFCWLDKWWLCGAPEKHDTDAGAWDGPTMDNKFNDEWLGICGQGDGTNSPFSRRLRKAYYLYRDKLWAD